MTTRACAAVPDCDTGARLRVCHECGRVMCLNHSAVVEALVWSSNGSTTFSTRRHVRVCTHCTTKIERPTP